MLSDEGLSHYLQPKQLHMHVGLRDGAEVKTEHIGSEFMG